jgi:hypothetical protein
LVVGVDVDNQVDYGGLAMDVKAKLRSDVAASLAEAYDAVERGVKVILSHTSFPTDEGPNVFSADELKALRKIVGTLLETRDRIKDGPLD